MPVLKPRNRLVNFRLSEEEYERLKASCALHGARSLSDFARAAVLRAVVPGAIPADPIGGLSDGRVNQMDRKIHDLENRVSQLLNLVEALRVTDEARSLSGVPRD
ncbi:MAG: hypothetical protein JNK87_30020 [Bryobacterales bacterium]|nr:hypothetical protein [Bryobacterales bacterium]